ncbi:MAG: hypothetical protein M1835_003666, partial [Candelina submexicana]
DLDIKIENQQDLRMVALKSATEPTNSEDKWEPVLSASMLTPKTGRKTLIFELRYKDNDYNDKLHKRHNWILAKDIMLRNNKFVPDVIIMRHITNTVTQSVAVDAKGALSLTGTHFTLRSDAAQNSVEQQWFTVMMGTDNCRPSGTMLNVYPRYFEDRKVDAIHIWKKTNNVNQQGGRFTMAQTLENGY